MSPTLNGYRALILLLIGKKTQGLLRTFVSLVAALFLIDFEIPVFSEYQWG